MELIDGYKEVLKGLMSKKRYTHSVNVATMARELAVRYGEDEQRALTAGILHDICKEIPADRQKELVESAPFKVSRSEILSRPLWHAIAGACYVQSELNIKDTDIVNSIRFHTVARAGMTRLEEIIYLADLVSIDREYKDVKRMRKLALTNIDEAMLEALRYSISEVMGKNGFIPESTFEAYNQYIYVCEFDK